MTRQFGTNVVIPFKTGKTSTCGAKNKQGGFKMVVIPFKTGKTSTKQFEEELDKLDYEL